MSEKITQLYYGAKSNERKSLEELLERLHPLILSSIKKYYRGFDEFDDLLQEGRIMVLECVVSFNKDLNVPFLGYVKSKLKYLYLSNSKGKICHSLNQIIGNGEDELIELIPSDENIENTLIMDEESRLLEDSIELLPQRQRQIIWDFYFNGMSIFEISKKYNLTYRTILNTKSSGLKNLRKELKNYYD